MIIINKYIIYNIPVTGKVKTDIRLCMKTEDGAFNWFGECTSINNKQMTLVEREAVRLGGVAVSATMDPHTAICLCPTDYCDNSRCEGYFISNTW